MQNNKKPNFLIVGTAKAGTSAIAKYLNNHNEIYIPDIKEPRYFLNDILLKINTDDPLYDYLMTSSVFDWQEYLDLYCNLDSCVKWTGDASVQYLYHFESVIPKIKKKLGDVSIIIVLRNPIQRAFSNYKYQFRSQYMSFEDSLKKEDHRKDNNYNSFWFYKDMGLYYQQVNAFINAFSNVHVCFYEDFVDKPEEFMDDIFKYLKLNPSQSIEYKKRYNETLRPRNRILLYFNFLKTKYGINLNFIPKKVRSIIKTIVYKKTNIEIDPKTSSYLKDFFKSDIQKLEKLINKDLSSWYKK